MNRRDTLVALLALGVASLESKAQQPAKIPRIGFLGAGSASAPYSLIRLEAFRAGLSELRYIEGKNILIEPRWADGNYERLFELDALAFDVAQLAQSSPKCLQPDQGIGC